MIEAITKSCYDKRYEDLTLADDFMFKLIFEDPVFCKRLIEIILGLKITRLVSLETEKTLNENYFSHSVRFDVYVEGKDEVIDIELQRVDTKELPERARVYQGSIDIETFRKGERYSDIKESYIIFFCLFDPFRLGLPVYTVEQIFKEARDKNYNDRTHKVFYNCPAFEKCADTEIRAVLKLLAGKTADSDFTKTVANEVKRKIENKYMRSTFMGVKELIAERKTEWFAEGAYNKAVATAKKALNRNIPITVIADLTDLPLEEIERLQ